jgi:hypothetical protein
LSQIQYESGSSKGGNNMAQQEGIKRIAKISGFVGFLTILLLGALNQPAHAMQMKAYPDITVEGISVDPFNSTTTNFSAQGFAVEYKVDSSPSAAFTDLPNSFFDLFATVTGGVVGGTVNIYDDLNRSGSYDTLDRLYLSGNLTSITPVLGDAVLDILFKVTGGEYQDKYGTNGGIILGGIGLNGSTSATADVGVPVPEPSTLSLLFLGAGGLCYLRRRKSQS